jgi:hypothetical protein
VERVGHLLVLPPIEEEHREPIETDLAIVRLGAAGGAHGFEPHLGSGPCQRLANLAPLLDGRRPARPDHLVEIAERFLLSLPVKSQPGACQSSDASVGT